MEPQGATLGPRNGRSECARPIPGPDDSYHGCFGDQLWVHARFAAHAERTLRLPPSAGQPARDSGKETWFGNCTKKGAAVAAGFHAASLFF